MKSFTLGNYRLDIVSHSRVFNPTGVENTVAEAFEVDLYDISNPTSPIPFDWYPNTKPHPHPERRQRQTFYWYGKQFQDVYDDNGRLVGVKRGADFRTRFFPSVIRRIEKAESAKRIGLTIGEVREEDVLKSNISEPINMRGMALNEAIEGLTREPARIVNQIPRGTVANIDADYDGDMNAVANTKDDTDTVITTQASGNGGVLGQFGYMRFPLTSIPDSTINDVDCQVLKTAETVESGEDLVIAEYTVGGDVDPSGSSAATLEVNYSLGAALATITGEGTGSVTVDLGATADASVQANLDDEDFYALQTRVDTDWETNEFVQFEAIENAGTDPATLIVDYTEVADGVEGTIAAIMQEPISASTGSHSQSGSVAATMQMALATMAGYMKPEGALAGTMQFPTASMAGYVAQIVGQLTGTLQPAISAMIGEQIQSGSIAATMEEALAAINAYLKPIGTIDVDMQMATGTFNGLMIPEGTLAGALQVLTMASSGNLPFIGQLSATIALITFAANGFMIPEGSIVGTLQRMAFTGVGEHVIIAALAASLQQMAFSSGGEIAQSGSIAATLAMAIMAITGEAEFSGGGHRSLRRPSIIKIIGYSPNIGTGVRRLK